MINIDKIPLGKAVTYDNEYSAELLFPLPRSLEREKMGIVSPLLFKGVDVWHAYELSWLNSKGKPVVAIGTFFVPCHSPNLIESKSFKLYLNSFNQTKFSSMEQVKEMMQNDLSKVAGAKVKVKIETISHANQSQQIKEFDGIDLDALDVTCDVYKIESSYLSIESEKIVQEALFSHLLKSNCLITNQPDWASIKIDYTGPKINHEGLLKYIVSYRKHNGFHEQCIEQIFTDIAKICKPTELKIYGCYTRRGGLNISSYRSTSDEQPEKVRSARQ